MSITDGLRWYIGHGGFTAEQRSHLLEVADVIDRAHAKARGGGFDEERYRRIARHLESALQEFTEWGC